MKKEKKKQVHLERNLKKVQDRIEETLETRNDLVKGLEEQQQVLDEKTEERNDVVMKVKLKETNITM